MCAPDPNRGIRMQARIEKKKKDARYASEKLKYWNRETSFVRGEQRLAMGLSRAQSDAYQKALFTLGKGRELSEANYAAYAQKRTGWQPGKDMRRGVGFMQYKALLDKQASIEQTVSNTFGRNMDIVQQGIQRQYMNKRAANREALGVRPEYGAPVFMPPKDRAGQMWANVQMGLSIASLATGFGKG